MPGQNSGMTYPHQNKEKELISKYVLRGAAQERVDLNPFVWGTLHYCSVFSSD